MKVWLDNEKPNPQGWVWVKTQSELEALLKDPVNQVTHVSLDYELDPGCGNGLDCAKFIAKGARDWATDIKLNRMTVGPILNMKGIPPTLVLCHSSSNYAKKEVEQIIGIAMDQWLFGLKELSMYTLANNLTSK